MTSNPSPPPKPWIQTPCIRSTPLSLSAGCNIYLKLETLQPSGSFKSRGIGNLLQRAITSHGPHKPIHFYCSSGGNAGLACVVAATLLQRPATIVVPMSTSALMIMKLKSLGADVVQKGLHWSEADAFLREELLGKDDNGVYVPPFDHEDVWDGNSTIADELEEQMSAVGGYDALVCSVGGGGMFSGIMQGLERHGHLAGKNQEKKSKKVGVLAVETKGADSLNLSVRSGKWERLDAITSIATSLGATQVARTAFEWGMRTEDVTSHVLSDAEAAMACVHLADDERIIVESACGASVATAYNGTLHALLFPSLSSAEFSKLNIVIVVCGGSNITLDILQGYKEKYAQDPIVLQKFHARRKREERRGIDVLDQGKNFEGETVVQKPAIRTVEVGRGGQVV